MSASRDLSLTAGAMAEPPSVRHPANANLCACQRQLDADGVEVGVSRQALDETLALTAELLEALKEMFPSNVYVGNRNVPDTQVLPCDVTMGELRRAAAAIDRAEGRS